MAGRSSKCVNSSFAPQNSSSSVALKAKGNGHGNGPAKSKPKSTYKCSANELVSYGETSSSNNSCASINDTAYLNKSGHKSQVHYVNSHGSIFTLATNHYDSSSQSGSSNRQQQVSYVQQTDVASQSTSCGPSLEQRQQAKQNSHPDHLDSSLASTDISNNSKHYLANGQQQQQQRHQQQQEHRRLQHQVHQQLQRIYGNAAIYDRAPAKLCSTARGCLSHARPDNRKLMKSTLTSQQQQQQQQQHHHRVDLQDRPYVSIDSINVFRNKVASATAEHGTVEEEHFSPTNAISTGCSDRSGYGCLAGVEHRHQIATSESVYSPSSERRSQLDELHYATRTATALLNATANAAAVIAAVSAEGHRGPQQQQQKSHTEVSIYSDVVYQDLKRQHDIAAAVEHERPSMRQPEAPKVRYTQVPSSLVASSGGNPNNDPATGNQIYDLQPLIQRQQQQQQANKRPAPQQIYRSVAGMPPRPSLPPQPPARRAPNSYPPGPLAGPISANTQADLIRQHQQRLMYYQRAQLQQLVSAPSQNLQPPPRGPSIPAFAVVHQNKVKASLKSELLSRLLISNLVAAQQAVVQPPSQPQPPPILQAENPYGNLAIVDKGRALFGPKTLLTANAHSEPTIDPRQATLVLRRSKERQGLIERVCQIDLTLFWWSLLIVSFFFMGATVTISRYIY